MGRILRALQKARTQREGEESLATEALFSGKTPSTPVTEPFEPVDGRFDAPSEYLVMVHRKESATAAQYRQLRTKLLSSQGQRVPHVIVVTSGTRGEGKTTLACNLAAAFAEDKSLHVLVLDANVDTPAAHLMLGVEAERGIGDVLSNGLNLSGVIYKTAIENLDLLPALPDERLAGSETVFDARTPDLLRRLRRHYDYIIIDAPSTMASSHASVIGKHADGVIVVAQAERTRRQLVLRALDELRECNAKVLGCVLTHVPFHIPRMLYSFLGTTSDRYYAPSEEGIEQEAGFQTLAMTRPMAGRVASTMPPPPSPDEEEDMDDTRAPRRQRP